MNNRRTTRHQESTMILTSKDSRRHRLICCIRLHWRPRRFVGRTRELIDPLQCPVNDDVQSRSELQSLLRIVGNAPETTSDVELERVVRNQYDYRRLWRD